MADKATRSDWEVWRFDQIATNVNVRIDNPSKSGMEHYVGLEHLDPDSLRIRRWGSPNDVEATKLCFKKGDIIFGRRRAYQRKLGVAEFDGICSAHAMVVRAKPEVVLPEFLPFFMQSDLFMSRAVEISVGSLSPTINWKTMAGQQFVLPPKEDQRRIVELLQAADLTAQVLEDAELKANELLRSLSKQQFSDRNFKCEQFASHYSIVSGQVDPRKTEYCDLPLIAPNHIESGTGQILKLESASEQVAISGKYSFDEGAVLYSKIRPNLVKATIAPCRGLCSADMYALMPKSTLRNTYLLEILLSDHFTQFAVSGSMRTGIPKLNREYLIQYNCYIPSIDLQDEYLARVGAIRKAKIDIEVREAKIKDLKNRILAEAFANGIH